MPRIWIDGTAFEAATGISVAAALQRSGNELTGRSVSGRPRAPVCGMGICQECRVDIDGVRRLACQTPVRDGMVICRDRLAGDAS